MICRLVERRMSGHAALTMEAVPPAPIHIVAK